MTEPAPVHVVRRVLPRSITILVVISVVVNVILAVAITAVAIVLLNRIHESQLTSCQASNVARHKDIAIWNRLLDVSPAQAKQQTAASRAEVKQLKALVASKDTQVNCAALYNTNI